MLLLCKSVVEITAAVEENITYKAERPKTIPQQTPVKMQNPNILYEEEQSKSMSIQEESMTEPSAIEVKLNNLQSLLEKQMKDGKDMKEVKPPETNKNLACIQLIYNQLISNEVDEKFANQIISEVEGTLKKDASMDNILSSIYQKIVLKLGQPSLIDMNGKTPKFVFFIGPTGVGKTTTIAKIASKFKMSEKAKVAFLTADTYRIAAVEQLRTYANILSIPLKVVYTQEELKQAKDDFSDYDLVFVDTAGRSHRNKEQRDDVEELINTISPEERIIYLVLSATTKKHILKLLITVLFLQS